MMLQQEYRSAIIVGGKSVGKSRLFARLQNLDLIPAQVPACSVNEAVIQVNDPAQPGNMVFYDFVASDEYSRIASSFISTSQFVIFCVDLNRDLEANPSYVQKQLTLLHDKYSKHIPKNALPCIVFTNSDKLVVGGFLTQQHKEKILQTVQANLELLDIPDENVFFVSSAKNILQAVKHELTGKPIDQLAPYLLKLNAEQEKQAAPEQKAMASIDNSNSLVPRPFKKISLPEPSCCSPLCFFGTSAAVSVALGLGAGLSFGLVEHLTTQLVIGIAFGSAVAGLFVGVLLVLAVELGVNCFDDCFSEEFRKSISLI